MNKGSDTRLFELLPQYLQSRDAENGGVLEALLRVIGQQEQVLEQDLWRLYDNLFIETCDDWVVPYLGDLVGTRATAAGGQAPGLARRDVADTVRQRRRKGSLALLEEVARTSAGWPARAVEFRPYVAAAPSISLSTVAPALPDLRDRELLRSSGTPFAALTHTADVRSMRSADRAGRYGPFNVGLFVWRLRATSATDVHACCIEAQGVGNNCFTFSPIGADTQLFTRTPGETDGDKLAGPIDVPAPITRELLGSDCPRDPATSRLPDHGLPCVSPQYYGRDRSFVLQQAGGESVPIPPERIVVADLSEWRAPPDDGLVAVDPVLGRIVFHEHGAPHAGVIVSYAAGFSAEIGGGEYHRKLAEPNSGRGARFVVSSTAFPTLGEALNAWREHAARPPESADRNKSAGFVIEIASNDVHDLPRDLTLRPFEYLQIRAADGYRPVLRRADASLASGDQFVIRGHRGSRLILDGVLVVERGLRIEGLRRPRAGQRDNRNGVRRDDRDDPDDICDVVLRHVTLVPGWSIGSECEAHHPDKPSLTLFHSATRLRISHSIVGAIEVHGDAQSAEPVSIEISDSIVDACTSEGSAVRTPRERSPIAFARLSLLRSTVFGAIGVHEIALVQDSIVTGRLVAARSQTGCVRFSYAGPGSRLPPAFKMLSGTPPQFASVRYGEPTYARLVDTGMEAFRSGASDEAEVGVFHDLFEAQRAAALSLRLAEHVPGDFEAGLIFAT